MNVKKEKSSRLFSFFYNEDIITLYTPTEQVHEVEFLRGGGVQVTGVFE